MGSTSPNQFTSNSTIRSRLRDNKVCKFTLVGMGIKRTHNDAGLLYPQGQQSFSIQPNEEGSEAANDIECKDFSGVLTVCQLSEQMVAGAVAANIVADDDDLPFITLLQTLHRLYLYHCHEH